MKRAHSEDGGPAEAARSDRDRNGDRKQQQRFNKRVIAESDVDAKARGECGGDVGAISTGKRE